MSTVMSCNMFQAIHFYTPWKRQKTFSFQAFSRVIYIKILCEMGFNVNRMNKAFRAILKSLTF